MKIGILYYGVELTVGTMDMTQVGEYMPCSICKIQDLILGTTSPSPQHCSVIVLASSSGYRHGPNKNKKINKSGTISWGKKSIKTI